MAQRAVTALETWLTTNKRRGVTFPRTGWNAQVWGIVMLALLAWSLPLSSWPRRYLSAQSSR